MGLKESLQRILPKVSFGEEDSVARASDGITRDAWYAESYRKQGNPPNDKLNFMLQIFQEDPVVNTAITTRVNAILDSGWTVEGKETPKQEAQKLLKKVGFNYSFLRQLFLNAILYRHVFIEVERNGEGLPVALNILETAEMEIMHDKHGDIEGYVQRAVTGEEVIWSSEDIVYIPFDKVTTSVWGNNGLRSLYETVTTKSHIEEFLKDLSVTHAWRDIIKVTRMNKDDVGSFISYMRDAQADATSPFVITQPKEGEISFEKMRDPSDLKEFQQTLEYLRSQILMVFKVPPIMVGLPDNSNRSNSDTQSQSFQIANNADRITAGDYFNNDLFEKLGLSSGVEFSWNPIDARDEKADVEMAEKLMNMGAKPEKVEEFLRKAGLDLPDNFFPTEEEMAKKQELMLKMKTPDDAASRPSRQRKSEGEQSQKIGTGSESTTRADQL